jgi:membrane fusion protein (multidrug efflux system)
MRRLLLVFFVFVAVVSYYGCGASATSDEGTAVQGKNVEAASTGQSGSQVQSSEQSDDEVLITVKKMAYEPFNHYFLANGTVEAVEDAFISPEINGQIKKIHVREGQRVKAGELLVSLSSDIIQSSIAEVKSSLALAETVYNRRKGLWEKKIGSEVQYLEAKTNKEALENRLKSLEAQLDMAQIKAPIDGIVDEVSRKEGELAVPGLQLIRLVNLKTVYVNADVSESFLPRISKGDPVQVSFPTYPDWTIDTVIYRTGNVIKEQNRTFLVQVKIDNNEEKLKPNIIAVLKMKDFSAEAALVVPSIIVKNDLNGTYVYVTEENEGKLLARKVYVTPGMSESGDTMIEKGLQPGQEVIVEGYNLVKNGMPVKKQG